MEYTTLDKISENLDSMRKPITSSERVEGEIPYYGASGIVDSVKDYIFDEPLLLVSEDGANLLARSTPIAFSIDGKTWVNNHAHVLRFRDRNLQKYVEMYLNHISLEAYITGSAQPKLNQKKLNEIPIPVADQNTIVQVVSTVEKVKTVIEQRKQELQKLDELIKARFVELFGTYPLNEKGWETGTIRDLVTEVRYGSSRKAADGDRGQYPYLRMNNITYGGELDLSDTKTIDVPEDELPKCTVHRGDVLFNRTNSKELVGKTCVYNRDEMMVLAGFVVRVRVNEKILPEVLSGFLNTDFSKQMLLGMCKAAIGQANINAQELQNIGIYIPPLELQRQFVEFKQQVDKSKIVVQKALDEVQLLFDSLMQQYFE